jgi:putative flippase GtrA
MYSIGAALAFAVDVLVLWALVEVFQLHYLAAAAAGFVAGTAVLYGFAVRYAFSFRRVADTRREFGVFAAVGLMGIVLNLAIIYGAVEIIHLHYLVAKIAASTVTFVANFGLRRALLFTQWQRHCTSGNPGSNL